MVNSSSTRRTLLRREEYLTPDYTPDQPIGRDDLLHQLRTAIQPVVHRKTPQNVYLYGPPGAGKTTVVTHLLDELGTETRTSTAFINCWQYNTRPALLAELLIQLGYPAPRKGKPVDELLAKLREWLTKHHSAVVALDEIDQLADATEVVYDLQHMGIESSTAVGVVLIADRGPRALQLEARSQSRLACHPVAVPSYTADDLVEILHHRADQAFQSEAVTDATLDLIATTVAEQGGDCRQALMLLLWAGRTADREEASQVTPDHVDHVLTTLKSDG